MGTLSRELAYSLLRSAKVEKVNHENSFIEQYPYKKFFRFEKDTLKTKEFAPEWDVPLPQKVEEGEPAPAEDLHEPYYWQATIEDYKVEINIHENAVLYDQSGQISNFKKLSTNLAGKLAEVEQMTYDKHCALIFDRAATSGYTGPDGKVLLATDHPCKNGDTYANKSASSLALNISNVETIAGLMMQTKNNAGNKIPKIPKFLITNPSQWSLNYRICKSLQQQGTANNDINALNQMGLEPVIWPNLASATAWFNVSKPEQNGLLVYRTRDIEVDADIDVHTSMYIFVVKMAFKIGWFVPWGVAGDPGT